MDDPKTTRLLAGLGVAGGCITAIFGGYLLMKPSTQYEQYDQSYEQGGYGNLRRSISTPVY